MNILTLVSPRTVKSMKKDVLHEGFVRHVPGAARNGLTALTNAGSDAIPWKAGETACSARHPAGTLAVDHCVS